MANRVIVIRHGRSTGNDDRDFYHWGIDSAVCLTPLGVKQAIHAADQLKALEGQEFWWPWHGVVFYQSEYTRAQQTCRIILDRLRLNPTVFTEPAINERGYGLGETPEDWHRNPWAEAPEAESLVHARRRFREWWNTKKELTRNRDIVLVCHGEIMKCINAELQGLPDKDITRCSTPNAAPKIYKREGDHFKLIHEVPPLKE